MIKTDIFREHGWFDEYYFFCPEDIALSTDLNNLGYSCYVNADVKLIHYEGMSNKSLSMIQTATRPASRQGSVRFYSKNRKHVELFLRLVSFVGVGLNFIVHRIKGLMSPRPNHYYVMSIGDLNVVKTSFSSLTPKELFIKYYSKIK